MAHAAPAAHAGGSPRGPCHHRHPPTHQQPTHAPAAAQCCWSPDEKLVLTGTSARAKDSAGSVAVLDGETLEHVGEIGVEGSAVAVQVWAGGRRGGHAGEAPLPPEALLHLCGSCRCLRRVITRCLAPALPPAVAPPHQPNLCGLWRPHRRRRAHVLRPSPVQQGRCVCGGARPPAGHHRVCVGALPGALGLPRLLGASPYLLASRWKGAGGGLRGRLGSEWALPCTGATS